MDYTIPTTVEEILALREYPVNAELLAAAMAGVVQMARRSGKSLEELTAEMLEEDEILDPVERRWLSNMVAQAWTILS